MAREAAGGDAVAMYRGGVFGSVSIPFVDTSGVVGVEDVTLGPGCANGEDISPTQRMLFDLGIYAGPIDGRMNTLTRVAITSFALANRVPRGAFCKTLVYAWQKKTAPIIEQLRKFAQDIQIRQTESPVLQTNSTPSAQATPPGWWDKQSNAVKVGVVVGSIALAMIGVRAIRTKTSYTPNKSRKRPASRRKNVSKRKPSAKEQKDARKRTDYAVEEFGRSRPPKGYPKKRSAYAWPEGWKYPINNKQRVRNAASRFGKHKYRYPPAVRAKIARRIDMAKKRFRIGEYR